MAKAPVLDSGGPREPRNYKPKKPKKQGISGRIAFMWREIKRIIRRMILPVGFVLLMFVVWFFLSQPSIEDLNTAKKAPSVLIKSEEGQVVGSYGDIYGDFLEYEEFPQALIDTVLATEDRNFFHHFGIDPVGIARAMVANMKAGKAVQGGSTITQQVAKNVFLTPERTLMRKFREVFLAFSLESRFTKEQIMAIYLNRVYLGAGNYGVDAAAKRYFDKSARELTLSESAILAGLLKAPSKFSPTANPELATKRAEQVLLNMVNAGYLKEKEAVAAKEALAQTMTRTAKNLAESSLYFGDWLIDQLPDYVGNVQEDLVVTATLKLPLQHAGEAAIKAVMDKEGEKMHASQAALIAMQPDGAVRALIGGRDYSKSPYNRAVQAHRQPGSSFKLFVYLAGLENGFTPSSFVTDQPITLDIVGGTWSPRNYKGEYLGDMPMVEAVAQSINTVAVQVAMSVGLDNVVGMAKRLGVTSDILAVPSIALGSTELTLLELTSAYAHLASNGAIVKPYGIIAIHTAQGREIYKREPQVRGQVLNQSVVGMMNSMLMEVIGSGTGRGASIGRPAAGKTGTTSDYRDAWFIGYTPDLVAGVWVGNDDNTAMKKVTGGTLPAPIWREFMKVALADVPARSLPSAFAYEGQQLPWQDGRETTTLPGGRPVGPRVPEAQDFELGQQFWKKLFQE